eukprot:CAMPEP_0177248118 /NCGR_PEP_ID=MMETSP0367-20130122/51982_1 /TAXON_ID=447022 ORGANISM="Scrippsiella hangoei-like, Strain SHHI-4" /NCGR_SAMPLE_ID=MMETSP0367 /ASSEMBLY_ACC=CAM_ASM_000362 /LENGTH=360 /DNA_ID=CAMNT_0018700403 /DNA_START=40 /DNA_END=1119 /DNA_ORIENTATION=+
MASGSYDSFGSGGGGYAPPPPLGASTYVQGPPPDRLPSEHSMLRSGGNGKPAESRANIWELVLVPWFFLVLVLACFLQAGTYGYYLTLVAIPVILLTLNLYFFQYQYKRKKNAEVVLGLLCLVAIVISLSVGTYSVSKSLTEYHRLSQGASYFNVLPSEAGASKLDATTLSFTNATLVDISRTFGFTDTRTQKKSTFCVAPVSDGNLYRRRVQFWAAGLDCCEARSNFNCLSPSSIGSHGALVLPADMQQLEGFKRAVLGAESAYDLTAGDNYLLVQWHEDPVGYRNGLFSGTMLLFGIFAGVYLIISTMVGCAARSVLFPKADPDYIVDPRQPSPTASLPASGPPPGGAVGGGGGGGGG